MEKAHRIKFGDLRIGQVARGNVQRCLDSSWVSQGPLVEEFEEKFARAFGYKHAIGTSSGTDAGIVVWSAIRELARVDWCEGEVITPACAFAATANCLLAAGLFPCFSDVSIDSLNLDRGSYIRTSPFAGGSRLIGVQFVATMGIPRGVDRVAEMAKEMNLYMMVDACEGHGATFNGTDIGKYGDAAIFSFYTAHLIVAGEGGMIVTDNSEIAELCRSIRSHGRRGGERFFAFDRIGYNSKMTDLEAAIGLEGLERFKGNFRKRRGIRNDLIKALKPFKDRMILFHDQSGQTIAPHGFPVVLKDGRPAAPLMEHLEARSIETKTLFGSLPTQHEAFKFLGYKLGEFPNAEYIGRCGLHFGSTEFMTDEDATSIAEAFREYFSKEDECKS